MMWGVRVWLLRVWQKPRGQASPWRGYEGLGSPLPLDSAGRFGAVACLARARAHLVYIMLCQAKALVSLLLTASLSCLIGVLGIGFPGLVCRISLYRVPHVSSGGIVLWRSCVLRIGWQVCGALRAQGCSGSLRSILT